MPASSTRTQRREAAEERTVRVARRRFARRQWARRWLAWRGVLASLVLAALLGGTVWLVFFSSALTVAAVRVEGTEVLDPGEVRRVASVPTGEPLASVDVGAIAARVEALAPVRSVDVSRSWPDEVRIGIVEREAVAVVERDGAVHGVDAQGVLFRTYPSKPKGLPVVRMSAATSSDALAEAAMVIDVLPDTLARQVDHLRVETIDSISLQMRSGRTVFWGSAESSRDKADVLAVLLKQKASVYDVSVPGQPTLKQ